MDVSDDDPDQSPQFEQNTVSLIVRVWADGTLQGCSTLRGHLSEIDGTRIGAFNSLDDLPELLFQTLRRRMNLSDRKG
ncbi:hypothetical protein [Sphingomonas sp. CARO-RG-8B-R24-01]|uniref:hypothetical protein n=1 Tax=Sphingomonas sp. CARO-RG-8B-R24-01 TaxID=2914831 RepID=UPI001F55C5F3|nr:hypothetical protein [Sphingomonas sp. CARO-RG-8B-R24-01]